jgi:hypothetical protein
LTFRASKVVVVCVGLRNSDFACPSFAKSLRVGEKSCSSVRLGCWNLVSSSSKRCSERMSTPL